MEENLRESVSKYEDRDKSNLCDDKWDGKTRDISHNKNWPPKDGTN